MQALIVIAALVIIIALCVKYVHQRNAAPSAPTLGGSTPAAPTDSNQK